MKLLGSKDDGNSPISKASYAESKVCYHEMAGDYYRYIAEFTVDAKKEAGDAMDGATKEFPVTQSFRLGLALNFLVFLYEVLGNPDKACDMARTAFEEAIVEFDNVSEESYKDSTLIMQLLRDNLTLWTSGKAGDAEGNLRRREVRLAHPRQSPQGLRLRAGSQRRGVLLTGKPEPPLPACEHHHWLHGRGRREQRQHRGRLRAHPPDAG